MVSGKDILQRGQLQEAAPVIDSVIFGFGHRARSGKDTAAAIILKERSQKLYASAKAGEPLETGYVGYDIRIYSFAGELKREVNENAVLSGGMRNLFDDGLRIEGAGYCQENGNIIALPDWVQYEPDADMSDPLCPLGKQRSLLQFWGTELRRSCNPDYWVKKVAKRIAEEKPELAIITDMRFPNEMAFVQHYGEAIRVDRANLPALTGASGVHVSELALATVPDESWDAIIKNNGTLEEFRDKVLFTFDMLMSTHPTQR
jgi:hypothetical protein